MGKLCCLLILLFILPSGFVIMVYNRALCMYDQTISFSILIIIFVIMFLYPLVF